MRMCKRARDLFGPCWDDELSLAEREWLEGHFASCSDCRQEYEGFSRAVELVGTLPRAEATEGLAERVLARVRRESPAADVIGRRQVFADQRPAWMPVAAVAGVAILAFAAIVPWLAPRGGAPGGLIAARTPVVSSEPVQQPRLVSAALPVTTTDAPAASARTPTRAASGPVAVLSDSLFDHAEDVEFILDPVTLHRGRASTASRLPEGVQAEQTVITF